MSSWKKRALFLSAVLTLPRMVPAVTVALSFDMNDFYVSNSKMPGTFVPWSSFPGATLTGTPTAPVLSVQGGDYVEYGLDATVTNNNGLGLTAFQIGLTNGAPSVANVVTLGTSPTAGVAPLTIAAYFSGLANYGISDGAGGISSSLGTDGYYNLNAGENDTLANVTYGAGTPADLYSQLRIQTAPVGGQVQFTPSPLRAAFEFANLVCGTLGSDTATYNTHSMTLADNFGTMPVLTIKATQLRPIALIFGNSNVDPSYYYPDLGELATTVNDHYYASSAPLVFAGNGVSKGIVDTFIPVIGPPTNVACIGLKLESNGVPIPPDSTIVASIISDINTEYVPGTGTSQLKASAITGDLATDFPASDGWDLVLTWDSSVRNYLMYNPVYVGFDFSQDEDYLTPNITVTEIAGVPEPTLGIVGIAGMGLLTRRRLCKGA